MQMCVVFCESGLKDVVFPCILQGFICHHAVLHKVFSIGDKQFVVQRPSLKNFEAQGIRQSRIAENITCLLIMMKNTVNNK